MSQRLLFFDASTCTFRNMKLRGRDKNCAVCGDQPTITKLINYEQFCNLAAHDQTENIDILKTEENTAVEVYKEIMDTNKPHTLLDVRPAHEFEICSLPNSINIPFSDLSKRVDELKQDQLVSIYILCRRGNDSQRAVKLLKEVGFNNQLFNITGGLVAWSNRINKDFPKY